jgi:hypothetical protein
VNITMYSTLQFCPNYQIAWAYIYSSMVSAISTDNQNFYWLNQLLSTPTTRCGLERKEHEGVYCFVK